MIHWNIMDDPERINLLPNELDLHRPWLHIPMI